MKKIISIVLAVMLVVSVAAVSAGAYQNEGDYSIISPGNVYNPTDSYTVDANTPYGEDAVRLAGGNLSEIQKIYFQAPEDWANKFNTFAGPDDPSGEAYPHYCGYWWDGAGTDWSDLGGGTVKWCGYQAHMVDRENRIYCLTMPNDGDSSTLVINNGINGGMDSSAEIFQYAKQWMDMNTEGAFEDEYDTLPEGSPTQEDFDGCIAIENKNKSKINDLTGFPSYGSDWYIYYGSGCYGYYPMESANFHGRIASCVNPEHNHPRPGDVNDDKIVDTADVLAIQEHLAHIAEFEPDSKQLEAADTDGDEYVTIIDATRIQRYLAKMCNMDGSKPYKEDAE